MSEQRRLKRTIAIVTLTGVLSLGAFGIGMVLTSSSPGAVHGPHASGAASEATANGPSSNLKAAHDGWRGRKWFRPGGRFRAGPFGGIILGQVTGHNDGTLTIKTVRNGSRTVDTTSSTKYFEMLAKSSPAAVTPGARVLVLLASPKSAPASSSSTGSTPDALAVDVIEPFTLGKVVSASSGLIVVTNAGGLQRDIIVDASTAYSEGGKSVSESAVKAGERVFAYGSVGSNPTELDATHVVVLGSAGSLRKMIRHGVARVAGPPIGARPSGNPVGGLAFALLPALLGS